MAVVQWHHTAVSPKNGCFIILLIITPIYIWRVTTVTELPPAVSQIIISTLLFAVWLFALGGPFTN